MKWNWIINIGTKSRSQARSEALARRAIRLIDLPWQQSKAGLWIATGAVHHGYAVSLNLLAHDWFVMCMASANIVIDRHWIQRELALVLLEENHQFAYGSFRLSNRPEGGRELVLGHLIDPSCFNAEQTANVAQVLNDEMRRAITRLYALNLICEGPVKRQASTHFNHKGA